MTLNVKIILMLFLLIPVILLLSCNDREEFVKSESPIDYTNYHNGDSLDSDILLKVVERYKSYEGISRPELKLWFITTKIYQCMNFLIQTSSFEMADEMIVRLEKVNESGVCFYATGPAQQLLDLPEHIKKLVILNGNKIDIYKISTTVDSVVLKPIYQNFSNIDIRKIYRYPENSFAYVCGTTYEYLHIYDDFFKIINDSLDVLEFKFGTDGIIPYPVRSSGNWINCDSRFFLYNNTAEFEKAGKLLKNFTLSKIKKNSGVKISLVNWDNNHYKSWTMYK